MSFDALFPWMPVFNTIHAIGLTLLLGAVVVLSLRLLGLLMPHRSLVSIAKPVNQAIAIGIAIMLVTGLMLFLPEIDRWIHNWPFRAKMLCLAMALTFHFTVFRKVGDRDDASPASRRLIGVAALVLWYAVGMGGRAITFLGE